MYKIYKLYIRKNIWNEKSSRKIENMSSTQKKKYLYQFDTAKKNNLKPIIKIHKKFNTKNNVCL